MKKILLTLFIFFLAVNTFSQSMAELERYPSFKGITIGEPISKYSSILNYQRSAKGKTVYTIIDKKFYSIFDISMDKAVVLEKDGVVDAVLLSKTFVNSKGDLSELKLLEVLESDLASKYGSPNVNISNLSITPAVFGVRWRTHDIYIDIQLIDNEKPQLQYFLYKKQEDY